MGTAFSKLAQLYLQLEQTPSYNKKRELLSLFFKKLSRKEIASATYLTLGRIGPIHGDIDLGIAGKMAKRAIAQAYGVPLEKVRKLMRQKGDLGLVAQELDSKKRSTLTIAQVHAALIKLKKASGKDSQKKKLELLASLLKKAGFLESRYIVRIVLHHLRIGVGAEALMDSFITAFPKAKTSRKELEAIYHLNTDMGLVAEHVFKNKHLKFRKGKPILGSPIRTMLAQRVKTISDIRKKMIGCKEFAAEEKYDGERIQIHKNGNSVIAFSRRLTNITVQYPAIMEAVKKSVKFKKAILDGEVVAYKGGKILPFQKLMQRRRKHEIEKYQSEIPAAVFLFDILYLDGKSLLKKPYPKRRKILKKAVKPCKEIHLAGRFTTPDFGKIHPFFKNCIKRGLEGVIVKSTAPDSIYEPGKRSWLWIKWKPEYSEGMRETFDLAVIGSYAGKGSRRGHFGALLCAIYNKKKKTFESFTKVGTGYKDSDFAELEKLLKKYKVSKKPFNVKITSATKPDIYYRPGLVLEALGAEITKSPSHSSGYALRFPRFLRVREDKSPAQATTLKEIEAMKNG